MEFTLRELATEAHGMLFGLFFAMAVFGVLVVLLRASLGATEQALTGRGYAIERACLIATAALGWAAVLSGAYIVYPWYRATPIAGTADFSLYPRMLLLSSPATAGWHNMGMEWKEHVAWFAPIAMTMAAYVLIAYRGSLRSHKAAARAVAGFAMAALLAAGIAGYFGAMLDKRAPVRGGATVRLTEGAR